MRDKWKQIRHFAAGFLLCGVVMTAVAFTLPQRVMGTVYGDVNADGAVDIDDVNEVLNVILDIHKPDTATVVNGRVTTFDISGVQFNMVGVEGGTFSMGGTAEQGDDASSSEFPVHQVTLSDFSIGQTPVTQRLWRAVMGKNPSYFSGDLSRPVEKVSWDDCQEFITKLNEMTGKKFRLPTEAEWEFAARGGTLSKGYKYSGSDVLEEVGWCSSNASKTTHPVGLKKANELGLYDMSGNVREWCYDWYGAYSYSSTPQVNPTGPETGNVKYDDRVLRGGSWNYQATYCRVSARQGARQNRAAYEDAPAYPYNFIGLRLAM